MRRMSEARSPAEVVMVDSPDECYRLIGELISHVV